MNTLLKLEEAAIFLLCLFLFGQLDFVWWWFPLLLLFPDIGIIGYIVNPRIGASTYNLLHNRFIASIAAICGLGFGVQFVELIAIILFAHISMDRAFGFGLKRLNSFNNTHLDTIGENQK